MGKTRALSTIAGSQRLRSRRVGYSGGVWGRTISTAPIQIRHVGRIVKRLATGARLERGKVADLSSHSMRVGAAQDMAVAGIELVLIMNAGGWESLTMVIRYIEHLDAARSGMARMYEMNKGAKNSSRIR